MTLKTEVMMLKIQLHITGINNIVKFIQGIVLSLFFALYHVFVTMLYCFLYETHVETH